MMASSAEIPVIDVSATGEDAQASVAKELVEAAIQHGFVYIRNKGDDIPVDAVENAFSLVSMAHLPPNRSHAVQDALNIP